MLEIARRASLLVRPLFRRPIHSLLVIGVLALGLGTTLGVLAVAEGVLLRELPVEDPDRLIYVASKRLETGGLFGVPLHRALEWRRTVRAFEGLAVIRGGTVHWRGESGAERLGSVAVTPEYFAVTGSEPRVGRAFRDDDLGGAPAVLLSHELWQRRFGAEEAVLGRTIDLDGTAHTVVGVMPPGPSSGYLGRADLWTPLVLDEAEAESRQMWGFSVLARLRDGVGLDAARRQLGEAAARLAVERPEWDEGWGAEARPVREWMSEGVASTLRLVTVAAFLVLLVACVTAGNLLYAGVAGRAREMAVRRALGAGGGRLFRQLAAESAASATVAALLGLGLAVFTGRWALSHLPAELLGSDGLGLNSLSIGPRTWTAAVVTTLFVALLCAGLSALALRRSGPPSGMRSPSADGGRRLRGGLVALETALATVAVLASVLTVQSLHHVRAVAPGFEAEGLLTLRFDLPPEALAGPMADKETRIAALRHLRSEVESLSGVDGAALAAFGLPLSGDVGVFQLWVEGRPRGPQPDAVVHAQVVSPGFFETLGVERLAGRDFTALETWESDHAVVVNRAFVDAYLANGKRADGKRGVEERALGRWVEFGNGDRGTVVGVVDDVHQLGLDREPSPEVFLAWGTAPAGQSLLVRAEGDAAALVEPVRRRVGESLPGTPVFEIRTGEDLLRSSYADRAVTAWALGALAGLAQVLGLVGLYGLVLHWVTRRRRDLGVRAAIGARPVDLARWTLGFGLRPVVLGVVVGLGTALAIGEALGRTVDERLFGVRPSDPEALALTVLLVLATALVTCLAPARRAATVDPAAELRAE